MPLKLDFKAGDKLVINGAVLENIGTNAKILVHNESAILREKEILSVEDTATPASRVYFALQCAYMFPHKKEEYVSLFGDYLRDFVAACPSTQPIADEIEELVGDGKIYKALKQTQKLIAHQAKVLKNLEDGVEDATADVITMDPGDDAEDGAAEAPADVPAGEDEDRAEAD